MALQAVTTLKGVLTTMFSKWLWLCCNRYSATYTRWNLDHKIWKDIWDSCLIPLQWPSSESVPPAAQTFSGIILRNCGSVTFIWIKTSCWWYFQVLFCNTLSGCFGRCTRRWGCSPHYHFSRAQLWLRTLSADFAVGHRKWHIFPVHTPFPDNSQLTLTTKLVVAYTFTIPKVDGTGALTLLFQNKSRLRQGLGGLFLTLCSWWKKWPLRRATFSQGQH